MHKNWGRRVRGAPAQKALYKIGSIEILATLKQGGPSGDVGTQYAQARERVGPYWSASHVVQPVHRLSHTQEVWYMARNPARNRKHDNVASGTTSRISTRKRRRNYVASEKLSVTADRIA